PRCLLVLEVNRSWAPWRVRLRALPRSGSPVLASSHKFTTMPAPAQRRLTLLLDAAREHHTDQLAVVWRGEAREWCFSDADGPLHVQSVTKSVVNLIVGRLVTLGHLGSIDEPVHRLYPEWRQGRKRL